MTLLPKSCGFLRPSGIMLRVERLRSRQIFAPAPSQHARQRYSGGSVDDSRRWATGPAIFKEARSLLFLRASLTLSCIMKLRRARSKKKIWRVRISQIEKQELCLQGALTWHSPGPALAPAGLVPTSPLVLGHRCVALCVGHGRAGPTQAQTRAGPDPARPGPGPDPARTHAGPGNSQTPVGTLAETSPRGLRDTFPGGVSRTPRGDVSFSPVRCKKWANTITYTITSS